MLVKNNDGEGYQICPAGTHQAVCIAVYDLGMQEQVWNGESKVMHKCIISFEIDERMSGGEYDGKRFVISKQYTASLGQKANLRKDLESWRGKRFTAEELDGFDLSKLIGVNALLSIVHTEKGDKSYANIEAISPIVKNMQKLTKETDTSVTPKWIAEKISKQINRMQEKHPDNSGQVKRGVDIARAEAVAEQFDGSVNETVAGEDDCPF